MNFRQQHQLEPDVNLTPLIDVVFLLLIFFMVSTTFVRQSEISVDLPEASKSTVESEEISLEITIDVEGRFFVNQQLVINQKIETLKRALEKIVGENETSSVVISADANTPHQAVITAMDAARQLGIVHVSLATKSK